MATVGKALDKLPMPRELLSIIKGYSGVPVEKEVKPIPKEKSEETPKQAKSSLVSRLLNVLKAIGDILSKLWKKITDKIMPSSLSEETSKQSAKQHVETKPTGAPPPVTIEPSKPVQHRTPVSQPKQTSQPAPKSGKSKNPFSR